MRSRPGTPCPKRLISGAATRCGPSSRSAADQFAVAADDLRLRLSTNGAGDPSWFDVPIEAGTRCEIVQVSAPNGSRMVPRIHQYQRDRLVMSKPIMVDLLVRRTVVSPVVSIEAATRASPTPNSP